MVIDTDDPAEAAERLEAALERIAAAAHQPVSPSATTPTDEVATRLDALIHRLRTALGGVSG